MKRILAITPALLLATAAHAGDPACKPIDDASAKSFQQPGRHSVTESGDGSRSESIVVGGVLYMTNNSGKWFKSPVQTEQEGREVGTALMETLGMKDAPRVYGCRKLGTENVDGVTTTVHSVKMDMPAMSLFGATISPAKTIEHKYYIGKDGLVYAEVFEDTRTRWKYTGVTAPKL